ncbi:TetR/AcrR family transcriptional regulator [Rhodopseudomonas palustris]|uniref:TetR/AcrR family transcriptional regulator n=1 Tax=Rhodopseudomonas palustris TaxID=1076 RepID=UPI002ACE82AE|nr:TetR/AcrR family transcriptional regulator [Rhodopseudomonas palustris]WQG99223.1 TetR/AcrR family transcriptional regulator [Rhodopseudomonas palustris]
MSEKPPPKGTPRRVRADAQRNLKTLLDAALTVFATSGVEAPVREIAEKAGVGIGTLYRHFPQRSDLIVAVFRNGVDACAEAAAELAASHPPFEALSLWMQRYVDFVATKRGLAAALYSGDPAYDSLPAYFEQRLRPALQSLLDAAGAAGEIRRDIEPFDLLKAVAQLCTSAPGGDPDHTSRMVALLIDGLRYGAGKAAKAGD